MADPWRATTPPGALRSTPTPRRSRHVHVWDRLKSQAVPPQSWIGTARGWGRFTAIPNQCKHRGTADPAGSSSQDRTMMPGLGLVLVFHSLIYSLHLITSMLNLVWPLFRLGGVLWGRLLPPSLPSPLPCPGRGMRDLEGLSTEVPLGFTGSPPGMVKTVPPLLDPTVFSLLSLLNCFIFYQYRLPACLHAPQCLCFSSTNWTTPAFCPQETFNQSCFSSSQHQRWWWNVVPEKAVQVVTVEYPEKNGYNSSS